MSFCFFVIIFPLEKGMALYFKKPESHSPKDVCAKVGQNRPNGSGEKDLKISSMYFRLVEIGPVVPPKIFKKNFFNVF